MDTAQLVWIIVAIVIVIAVVALVAALARKRRAAHAEQQREADRRRAEELRQTAQQADLQARERDATALKAEADARQAEVEAERLRMQAERHAADARSSHDRAQDHFRQAEEVDPDGRDGAAHAGRTGTAAEERTDLDGRGPDRTVSAAEEAGQPGTERGPAHRADVRAGSGEDAGTVSGTDSETLPREPGDGRRA
jgi:membrane-bound lytic murein transglycosylase